MVFALLILVSCATFDFSGSDVTAVEVLEFEQMGRVSDTMIATFTEDEHIDVFVDAVNRSRAIRGDLDIGEADYDLRFLLNGDDLMAFHLWIEKEPNIIGTIVEVENTTDGYDLTEESVKELLSILKK